MQQLFPSSSLEELRDSKVGDQVFSVPASLKATIEAQLTDVLNPPKRGTKSGHKRSREDTESSDAPVPCRNPTVLRHIIEYGLHYTTASESFRRRLASLRRLRQGTPHQGAGSTEPLPQAAAETELCQYAVRAAMSLVSHVVAADAQGLLLRPLTREPKTTNEPAADTTAPPSAAARTSVELYCVLQALEIELQDALSFPADPATAEQARSGTQRRILACVDALEETLLDMLLARCNVLREGESASGATTADERLAALRDLLLRIPQCFTDADWPSRLVNSSVSHTSVTDVATEVMAGEEAVTAILLRALATVREADACDALQLASAPPVATLAAQAADTPCDLDPDHCTFPLLVGRTWSGMLGARGLRRAALEARIFFAFQTRDESRRSRTPTTPGTTATAAPKSAKTAAKSGGKDRNELRATHTRTEMWALRHLFSTTLQREHVAFLSHIEGMGPSSTNVEDETQETATLAAPSTVFVLARNVLDDSHTSAASLTDAQVRSLRVLDRVKAFDTKQWFTVPAFDLVNVDFASLRLYVRGKVFAQKSKRGAFDALRRLLEQMVDKCVAKYGPTHEFSDCISTLRHKLVDAARQEQLL